MILLQDLLKETDSYKTRIGSALLSPSNIEELLDQYFRITFTYSSSALEGNPLTLSQAKTLLEDASGIERLPGRDSLEIIGGSKAYDFMKETAKQKDMSITEDTFKELHRIFYQGIDTRPAGRYRTEPAFISDKEAAPGPDEIPHLMSHLADQIHSSQFALHPVELAAMAHKRLMDIQPFTDGNGIIARLLMNLLLVHAGYSVVSISPVRGTDYLYALSVSRRHKDMEPFSRLVAECAIETAKTCCRLFSI